MNDKTKNPEVAQTQTEKPADAVAAKAPPREIIRGRMPVSVVALARFGSQKDTATKAAAEAFGTTVGKIDDIRKNRNFAYVTADFRPTEQQKADGIAWLERHPSGAKDLIAELKAVEVATAEQAAAFESVRAANRGQSNKTKEGGEADAGGGNRRNGNGKKGDKPASTGDTAGSLLS